MDDDYPLNTILSPYKEIPISLTPLTRKTTVIFDKCVVRFPKKTLVCINGNFLYAWFKSLIVLIPLDKINKIFFRDNHGARCIHCE